MTQAVQYVFAHNYTTGHGSTLDQDPVFRSVKVDFQMLLVILK